MLLLEITNTEPRPRETKPATAMSITNAGSGLVKIAFAHDEQGIHICTNETGAMQIIALIEEALEDKGTGNVRSH